MLCSSANELQQNSNASSREDYIPQILTVLLEIHRVYIWPLWSFAFCLSNEQWNYSVDQLALLTAFRTDFASSALNFCRWVADVLPRETSLSGDKRGETSAIRRLYFSVPGVSFQKLCKGAYTSLICLNYSKVWTNSIRAFWKYFEWNKVLRVIKTVNKHAIDIIGQYLKKMIRSVNAVWFHCGLISFKTVHKKGRGFLRPIVRKENLIAERSAAFFTTFICNLVDAYIFHGNLKTAW